MSVYLRLKEKLNAIENRARQLTDGTAIQGYTVSQLLILKALYDQDAQRASDLADAVHYPRTAFTPILDSLQIKSLITRLPDAKDRRAINIVLTRSAKDVRFKNAVLDVLSILNEEFR